MKTAQLTDAEWQAFLACWHDRHDSAPITAREALELAPPELAVLLPEAEPGRSIALARLLRRKIQERCGPLVIERDVRADSGPTRYLVIDPSRPPEPPEQRAPAEPHPAERLPARNRQERYWLRALWRRRPDLFERVVAGDMARWTALVEAGIVMSDAEKKRRRLANHS